MIKEMKREDVRDTARLALLLWPNHKLEDFIQEITKLEANPDAVIILAYHGNEAVGFAQCQLRHDYVEGTRSSPVGYLEGLYVKKEFRKRGYAKEMVSACEKWAKEKGCREFASDCELANKESLAMHLKLNFREANRIICFTKEL